MISLTKFELSVSYDFACEGSPSWASSSLASGSSSPPTSTSIVQARYLSGQLGTSMVSSVPLRLAQYLLHQLSISQVSLVNLSGQLGIPLRSAWYTS